MKAAHAALVLALVAGSLASCDDAEPAGSAGRGDGETAASGPTVPLAAWVDAMLADEAQPDTVDDKVGVVIDTDDEAAFDKLLK